MAKARGYRPPADQKIDATVSGHRFPGSRVLSDDLVRCLPQAGQMGHGTPAKTVFGQQNLSLLKGDADQIGHDDVL
jgi:hypothetical protein